MEGKVVKEISQGRTLPSFLCSVWRVIWRGMKVALSRPKKVERKRSESGETIGAYYATGRKIEFDQKYQIPKDR
jgi:hypothetical protein